MSEPESAPPPDDHVVEPFAIRAAKYSLYFPFFAIIVNLSFECAFEAKSPRFAIGIFNSFLIFCGLISGILALVKMERGQESRVMVRAIVGILINGLVIAGMIMLWSAIRK